MMMVYCLHVPGWLALGLEIVRFSSSLKRTQLMMVSSPHYFYDAIMCTTQALINKCRLDACVYGISSKNMRHSGCWPGGWHSNKQLYTLRYSMLTMTIYTRLLYEVYTGLYGMRKYIVFAITECALHIENHFSFVSTFADDGTDWYVTRVGLGKV